MTESNGTCIYFVTDSRNFWIAVFQKINLKFGVFIFIFVMVLEMGLVLVEIWDIVERKKNFKNIEPQINNNYKGSLFSYILH